MVLTLENFTLLMGKVNHVMAEMVVLQIPKEKQRVKRRLSQNQYSEYFLSEEQIGILLNSSSSISERTMIELMAKCGLRRNEVRMLEVQRIDFYNRVLNLVFTKRGKTRTIPIDGGTLSDLNLVIGNKRKEGFVFLNSRGRPYSVRNLNLIVAKAGRKAGLKNPNPFLKEINPHILRHSCARRWLRNGMRIEVVSQIMGHSSVKTTLDIYGRPSINDVKEQFERFGGLIKDG